MRTSWLAIALTLAIAVTQTGCDELFCNGDVVDHEAWVGEWYSRIKLSADDGVTLVTWATWPDSRLNAATFEGGAMLHRIELSPMEELSLCAVASAPNGHVLVARVGVGLVAISLDRRGQIVGQISLTEMANLTTPAVAFDGERFLIAWMKKGTELMLTSLVPGAAAPSSSVVVRTIPFALSLHMASGGGVTWITWITSSNMTRVEGIRVVDGAAVDPAPVLLLDDPRLSFNARVAMAWSSNRFLLAVDAMLEVKPVTAELVGGSLLVPIDGGGAAPGAVVELPGHTQLQLAGEAAGFTALPSSLHASDVLFGEHDLAPLAIMHLALDGAVKSEEPVAGNYAAFASDGGRIFLAVRTDSTKDGSSVLSFGTLDDPSTIQLATLHLEHEEGRVCQGD